MEKTLVITLGPHTVGKMTVGQALAKITPLRLFHRKARILGTWHRLGEFYMQKYL